MLKILILSLLLASCSAPAVQMPRYSLAAVNSQWGQIDKLEEQWLQFLSIRERLSDEKVEFSDREYRKVLAAIDRFYYFRALAQCQLFEGKFRQARLTSGQAEEAILIALEELEMALKKKGEI